MSAGRPLADLGWDEGFAAAFAAVAETNPTLLPARVMHQRRLYGVTAEAGDWLAGVSGRLRHAGTGSLGRPAVGDWVAVDPPATGGQARIQAVLPRRSSFVRKAAGRRVEEQVVAANIDTVFLVAGLDHDFNPRRLERYVTAAWNSGARPVLLLNKADLADDPAGRDALREEVAAVAQGVPVHLVSARTGEGLEQLAPYLVPRQTLALLGSSGVGKSTLLNRLLGGEVQRTGEVRESDDRGRHTTTHRELFVAQEGWLAIDTPGLRELQLWESDEGLETAFADIEELAAACAFNDCRHTGEPGCAVAAAIAAGALAEERLASYRKLQREQAELRTRTDVLAHQREKQRIKALVKAADRYKPRR
jgi:ribosome biogenesis GTPase